MYRKATPAQAATATTHGKAFKFTFLHGFQPRFPICRTGTRGEGRTLNLRLRRPTLYPIELLAQVAKYYACFGPPRKGIQGLMRASRRQMPVALGLRASSACAVSINSLIRNASDFLWP